ncbi:hypothetical protein HPB49_011749 [Dermacentor silvarum]|uniref:Uncharacterized protein n=1 Tax=Dermacentor silvarum TaxID=543639 RepID=A0ACB8DZV1_DERSI|nr:hypothetical protein HPB49_011749 [Dermacentor silvarum]
MGPCSGRLRESAAYMVGSHPSVCPSVNPLFSNLRGMRNIMGHHRVDLDKSCNPSAANGCFHLAERSLCNNFPWVINTELREGWPVLACLRGPVVPLAPNMQSRRLFILVHWLLMHRHSTEFVELRESRLSPKHFRGGLELSGNLRHAMLCYHLLDYPPRDLMDALRSADIVSVRFWSVGARMLCELRDRCNGVGTLIFLENWIDVPDTQALKR